MQYMVSFEDFQDIFMFLEIFTYIVGTLLERISREETAIREQNVSCLWRGRELVMSRVPFSISGKLCSSTLSVCLFTEIQIKARAASTVS